MFQAFKKACIDRLNAIGALFLLHMSTKMMEREYQDKSVSDDSDSDYESEDDPMTDNDDGNLEDYFLSTYDSAVYGKPLESIFHVDNMITCTKVVQWLPLGAICQNKNTNKFRKISHKKMIKGVVDRAVVYAQDHIQKNNCF